MLLTRRLSRSAIALCCAPILAVLVHVAPCPAADTRSSAATREQVAAAQQQVAAMNKLYCQAAVDNLMSQPLRADSPHHCDATYKAEFCRRLGTQEGFMLVGARPAAAVAGYGSGDLKEGAEFCGASHEEISARVCQKAEQEESLDVLAGGCVARGYGRALLVRECAGRNFSSPPAEKYRNFCGTVASVEPTLAGGGTRMRKGSAAVAATPAAPATSTHAAAPVDVATEAQQVAVEKGKQLLKGLFGR